MGLLERKDLLGLQELSAREIELILDTALPFKDIFSRQIKKVPTLRGKSVFTLFYEPSTRTKASFELAGKMLSADISGISPSTSSIVKGESLEDTGKTLEAMGADIIIIRHLAAGSPHLLAKTVKSAVINAGDGTHEHPTQGLLDMFTMRDKKGKIEGLKVTLVGDIAHSRVAKSNIWGLTKLGAEVTVVGPPTLIPPGVEKMGVRVCYDLKEALADADVINVLRIQLERQEKGLFPSIREYSELYGITKEKLEWAKKDVLLMHPGPMNRGVEISLEAATSHHAVIEEQVTNGVAVRMALLYLLTGGGSTNEIVD